MTKRKHKTTKNTISPELMDELLRHADGKELFGTDGFFQQLKRELVNGMLKGEMDHHLQYPKHDKSPKSTDNRRNGHYPKTVIAGEDTLELAVPRDRDGDFQPQIIPKGVRQFDGFDDKVISMYARGMTMREIQAHLYEIYGTQVSHELISSVTDKVMDEVKAWQSRPLETLYPVIFLDCIHVKTRDNHMICNKAVYIALAINMEGKRKYWGCGSAKTKALNSGCRSSQRLKTVASKIFLLLALMV